VAEALEAQILAEIRRIFATDLEHEEPVELKHDLLCDLYVDSLAALVLMVGLENRFRLKLTEEDTAGLVTVADLVSRVAERVRASS
jgi:acyl carrier protein